MFDLFGFKRGFAVPLSSFEEQINALLIEFEAAAADGISWAEAIELGGDFTNAAMALSAELKQPGSVKKEIVLRAVGNLFDAIAPRIVLPLPLSLVWLSPLIQLARPIVRPFVRALVLKGAEGLIESFFKLQFRGPPR